MGTARENHGFAPGRDPTVGQQPDLLIKDWAETVDVAGPLALFSAALRIRTATQAVLFRGALDALDQIAPILRSWDLNGSQTFGAAKLAAAWQRRPPHLDVFAPRMIGVGTSSDANFDSDVNEGLLSKQHDALFFLLGRPYPSGGASEAVHRRLRAWALLHGLRLFAQSPTPDKLLSRVSRSLAHAALEIEGTVWRDLLERIGAPADRWEQVDARFIAFTDSKDAKKRLPVHSDFLSACYQLAKFGSDPYEDKWAAPPSQREAAAWARLLESEPSAGDLDLEAFEPPAPAPLLSAGKADDSGESDSYSFECDTEQTVDEQRQAVQVVRFQLGAAARFLPWDWPQLLPPEREALARRVSRVLETPTHAAELCLAAITSVALAAGLSIEDVAAVPLSSALGGAPDWRLDLNSGTLIRTPPRHAAHWKPTPKTAPMVRPAAQELHVPLPMAAIAALRSAKQSRSSAVLLGHLWFGQGRSLSKAFRNWAKQDPSTARLQSSMVAKLLGQTTYERSNDSVLARLLTSNRVAPLPSSTVYTAYGLEQLAAAIPGVTTNPAGSDESSLNVAGSLLESADDDLVDSSFAELRDEIARHRAQGDVLQFHNAVALYWDATLRAATGARPVRGLWLSASHFDWDGFAVYIDDKASPVSHTGRLVPLPADLCASFKALYVDRHLPWIVSQLEAMYGFDSASLPALLFVLEEDNGPPDLVVIENKHRRIKDGNRIEGRLPLNLFRHRLRTLLHRETDVDFEVVDTVLGHGDGATLTHGNFSMRVWRKDAEAIRPALTRIFNTLRIEPPPIWQSNLPTGQARQLTWDVDHFTDRSANQQRKTAEQRQLADSIIRRFAADSNSVPTAFSATGLADSGPSGSADESLPALVASLTEEQLDVLSRRLLTDDQGMPSATGALRYERLLELAGIAWDELGLRTPFRKRYSPREIEPSPFTPLAAQASALMSSLRQRLDTMFETAGERSRIKVKHALALAIFDLVLTSRITNQNLLESVIAEDQRWRVVRFAEEFFLEWSPSDNLERKPMAPIQRFAISLRSAWLLQHSIRGKTRRQTAWLDSNTHAPQLSATCAKVFGADQVAGSTGLLAAVLSIVDQANICELPGSVAGFLAGRVWTASLGWGDWVRLRSARWVDATLPGQPHTSTGEEVGQLQKMRVDQLPEDSERDFEIVSETRYLDAEESATNRGDLSISHSDAAVLLINTVQRQLRRQLGDQDGSKHRARFAESLGKVIHSSAASVSSAVQLLCLWSIDLLLRPGRSRKLATSSVVRYFGALSKQFKAMAYCIDIAAMDDFEIEAFYASVLSGATVENLKDTYDGLRNFHKFSQMACGVPDIDWSVLAVSDHISLGSPGFVDEATYLELLDRLGDEHASAHFASWQLQCVALMAFRFGLRGGEATGLRRSDLHFDCSQPYLIVRNNRERDLKTAASRRVVPLLFDLTPVELVVIRKLQDFHAFDGVGLEDGPAFAGVSNPSEAVDGYKMRVVINSHLKAVTGQASTSMHKLRKAFAIRIWRAIEAPDYEAAGLPLETDAARQRIRLTLLGPGEDTASRRGAWSIARALGHGHPQVSARSYIHILSDVAQMSIAIARVSASLGLRTDLVEVPALDTAFAAISPARVDHADAPMATPVDALRALHFLSRGRSPSEAAVFSSMPIARIEELDIIANHIYRRFLAADPDRLRQHVDNPQSTRLARRGILSLLHVNADARLRTGLSTLTAMLLQRLSSTEMIAAHEWEAIVGGRREISMWKPNHFVLAAVAVRHFLESGSRLKLLAPRNLTAAASVGRLTTMAIRAGWLPYEGSTPGGDKETAPLCRDFERVDGLPRVKLVDEGHTADARLVLRLTGVDSNDRICDGLELAVALACLNAFCSTAHV